ncbi:hypothetical protein F4780DRAFT_730746 [Xylariomycetidae sp. FL0641]|nr:hypothetical protein F4780DRAFT_730746 [Xylariomycetidae sp. FL0641]
MSSQNQPTRPPTASELHLALLRPAILQILRAQGYYAASPSTIDCVTELAAQFMTAIAHSTAQNAANSATIHTYPSSPTVRDVRLALEECGALWPVPVAEAGAKDAVRDDTRGVDDFIAWATGRKNQRIRKVAGVHARASAVGGQAVGAGGEEEGALVEEEERPPTDYLDALKRKHNKTDQDSKYAGTILGRAIDHGEVMVEGGPDSSLADWARKLHERSVRAPDEVPRNRRGSDGEDERPPSSGLSSLTDGDVEMMEFD